MHLNFFSSNILCDTSLDFFTILLQIHEFLFDLQNALPERTFGCMATKKAFRQNAFAEKPVFFLSLMMGYLSSKDFDKAFMNWLAQGINTLGQLLLYIGVRILDKAGLKNC